MVEEDAFLSWSWVSLLLLSEAPWLLELWSVEEEEAFEEEDHRVRGSACMRRSSLQPNTILKTSFSKHFVRLRSC